VGGWRKGDEYYDAFMRLTPDDVTAVARRYLTPELGAAVVYRPERMAPLAANAEAFTALLASPVPAPLEPTPAVALPSEAPKTPATFLREEAGVRVYRTDRDIPVLIQVRPGAAITYAGVYASGGAIHELPNHAGISALAARASVKGTTTRTATQIAEASELLGGSIASSVGAELFGWSTSVPRDNILPALSLLADVVQRATLTDAAIETERTALLADLAQLRDDMYRYPMRLVNKCAYPDHPYGTPASGTETSVRELKAEDVRDWYRRMLLCAPFVIGVVGDVDADAMAAAIAGEFSALTMSEPGEFPAPVWPKRVAEAVEHREKAQSALALAFESPSRHDDRRFAAHVLATIASGLGGRFFDELRDRQSLAYTVHAFASEHRLSGAFVSYIATSPELEGVARAGLLNEFAKLRDEPVTDDELTRAKRYILGMHDIRQERGGSVLSEIIDAWLSGSGLHELDEYTRKINAVSVADIQRLAQQYFVDARRVEGVVRGVGKTV
jgi:zinc protease